jgi:hypothetical protein
MEATRAFESRTQRRRRRHHEIRELCLVLCHGGPSHSKDVMLLNRPLPYTVPLCSDAGILDLSVQYPWIDDDWASLRWTKTVDFNIDAPIFVPEATQSLLGKALPGSVTPAFENAELVHGDIIARSSKVCEPLPSIVGNCCCDFISLPACAWQTIVDRFVCSDEAGGHVLTDDLKIAADDRTGAKHNFSLFESVLIIKDFTIILDELLDSQGVDISEYTACIRRCFENKVMETTSKELETITGSIEVLENLLLDILGKTSGHTISAHGLSVCGVVSVSDWFQAHHARQPNHVLPDLGDVQEHHGQVDAAKPKPCGRVLIPAWTGLKVMKKDEFISSQASAKTNRHGGPSSSRPKRNKRDKEKGLCKNGHGKYVKDDL